ncbi:hypothetical protein L208DRAFT_584095 [Tricholoma matsutake]|nr:hypothetical protein L208DRAFT_584095 [Tricholoma matsutake 945]
MQVTCREPRRLLHHGMFYKLAENWLKPEDPGKRDPGQCQKDPKVSYTMSSDHKRYARICDSAKRNVSTSNVVLIASVLHAAQGLRHIKCQERYEDTYSAIEEVETPLTVPTLVNHLISFPLSMGMMRCERCPSRCENLLRCFMSRNAKIRRL